MDWFRTTLVFYFCISQKRVGYSLVIDRKEREMREGGRKGKREREGERKTKKERGEGRKDRRKLSGLTQ